MGRTSTKTKQYENKRKSFLPEIIIFCDVILCNLEERYQHVRTISVLPWEWTEQVPPQQCWQLPVRLHGITPYKKICIVIVVRILRITSLLLHIMMMKSYRLTKKKESSCHNAEGLKYKTAQQGLLWKLKKTKTFLHRCSAFGSTVFDCRVWWRIYEKYTNEMYNFK